MKDFAAVAYSYVRFSTPEQAKGDSLRRQADAADAWCARNNVTLDTTTTFRDLGRSAYTGAHRSNPDRHALATFLKLVEDGKVPRGSYLIIENLDRLSREHVQPALSLVLNLLQAGVRIVQLKPAEMVFTDQSGPLEVMMCLMELNRGHGESAIKSERIGAAWQEKKRLARAGKHILTHKLPAWIEWKNNQLQLIPERAAIVKRIYELAAAGYGSCSIVKRLNAEKVPPMGRAPQWLRSYVAAILTDRRPLGEFQPGNSENKPDGAVIVGYFPACITEDDWHAARACAMQRRFKPGRIGDTINLFTGLLRDARDGSTYARSRGGTKRANAILINNSFKEGTASCRTFPIDTFERAVLSCLREIDPHDILNGDHGPDETLILAGELARLEAKIAELEIELLNGDVAALAKVLRQLEAQKRELVKKLAEARQQAAHPLSESWGQAQSLLAALDSAPDPQDARLRLRGVLRRIVDSMWMVVVPRGHERLAAVQVWFAGGKRCRDYLIRHRPPKSNGKARVEGGWSVRSLAAAAGRGKLDLRKRADAARLEKALACVDLAGDV